MKRIIATTAFMIFAIILFSLLYCLVLGVALAAPRKWGYIDRTGKVVISAQFDEAGLFSNGLAAIKLAGKWGYIDRTGKALIPAQFDEAGSFSDGFAAIKKKNLGWVFINKRGGVVFLEHIKRENIALVHRFFNGRALMERFEGRKDHPASAFFIDTSGTLVTAVKEQVWGVSEFSEGLAVVDNGKYIDESGEIVVKPHEIPNLNISYRPFSGGLARIKFLTPHPTWSYIDRTGAVTAGPTFQNARDFSEGLAPVLVGDKWGFIDKTKQFVIEPQFDDAGVFAEGIAQVILKKKRGFVDKDGRIVVEPQFDDVLRCWSGAREVFFNPGWIEYRDRIENECISGWFGRSPWIDSRLFHLKFQTWNITAPLNIPVLELDESIGGCTSPSYFPDGLAPVRLGKKWGYADQTGRIVIQPQLEKASCFAEGLAAVKM